MANMLFLRLEGPLQSWGERARWAVRDSAPEPTKSGIVGLLGCTLGWGEDDALREISRQIQVGVRCDRPGTPLVDYHTVITGVMAANGKIKKNGKTGKPETVVTFRSYLCDASFLIAVMAAPDWIEQLAAAVTAPVWPVCLGRRSCPPARPVFEGTGDFESLQMALEAHEPYLPIRRLSDLGKTVQVRTVVECAEGQPGSVRRRDETGRSSLRIFYPRYTRDGSAMLTYREEAG